MRSKVLTNLTETKVRVRVSTNRLLAQGIVYTIKDAVNYTASNITPFFSFPPWPPSDNADLGMYKVATKFDYDASVKRINIAEGAPSEGDTGHITGWGKTKKRKGSTLRIANVRVISQSECEDAMQGLVDITNGMCCVVSVDSVADNCIADVGGPLLINRQLAGVVAYAPPCKGRHTKPVAVTNVGPYTSFVITTLCDVIYRN